METLPNVFLVCVLTTLAAALSHHFVCYRLSDVPRFVCAHFKTSGRLKEKLYCFLESIEATSKAGESEMLISMGF
jgi:hypothetical protein